MANDGHITSRQPIGTHHELWHIHGGESYLILFRPDQRIDAIMSLDNWWRKGIVTSAAKFASLYGEILEHTWSQQ